MPAPVPAPQVPPRFLFRPAVGGPTARYSEVCGATAGQSGLTMPSPPPAPNAPGGPTVASGGQTAHGTVAGGSTAIPGGQTARPFAAPSSPALPTLALPHVAPKTSVAPHGAPTTPPAPRTTSASTTPLMLPVAPTSQHYSRHPWAVREPSPLPLHQQSPPVKVVPMAPQVNPHPMTTRAKRGFWLPVDKLTLSGTPSSPLSLVPISVRATLADPSWRRAMEEEYDALITNNTWDLVPRPVCFNIVTGKWIFKHKFNSDGTLEWCKAH
jgi:hypothetical protein